MRTAHEEALARIKSVQDRLQSHKGPVPADLVATLFTDLTGACTDLVKSQAGAASASRKMSFAGKGDEHFERAMRFEALPRDIQVGMDNAYLIAKLLRKPVQETKAWNKLVEGSDELKKAMDTTDSSEWVPTGFSSELIKDITVLGGIESMHRHIAMPTKVYELPIQAARAVAYLATENTANTGQTAFTKATGASIAGKCTLTAKGLACEVLTSKELEEDSIIPILPMLRGEIVAAIARGIEEACLNGDTTGTHMDADIETAGATDRRTIWKGFRRLALTGDGSNAYGIDFGASGNGFNVETWLKVRAKLGKYGVNPADLYWVNSLNTYFSALSLKDAHGHAAVLTLDKMGSAATVMTGVLGMFAGSPILVSEFQRDDLDTTGVNSGVAADDVKSAILCVNRPGFVFGDRRDATVQVLGELYAEYGQDAVLATVRKDFEPVYTITSNALCAIGYNI